MIIYCVDKSGQKLAHWLHKQNKSFVFSQKKDTTFGEKRHKFPALNSIDIYLGVRSFYTNVKVTQTQGCGWFNLAVDWKKSIGLSKIKKLVIY